MAPRPSYLGFAPPYPVSWVYYENFRLPLDGGNPDLYLAKPALEIDSDGNVRAIRYPVAGDSLKVAPHRYALESLTFAPARDSSGQTRRAQLPLQMLTGDTAGPPVVTFPVDQHRRVQDNALYTAALERNGVTPPAIDTFPSYFFHVDPKDFSHRCPYLTYRVEIDSTGSADRVEFVGGDAPRFRDQLKAAANWATYKPARIDGHAVASHLFVTVAFFRQVHYPSAPAVPAQSAGLPYTDQMRVTGTVDTLGLMHPPVPWTEWSGAIDDDQHHGYLDQTITASIAIDTLGRGRIYDVNHDAWQVSAILGKRVFNSRFYPARTWSGQPVPFEGLVHMRYLDESNVRIWFSWLPGGPE